VRRVLATAVFVASVCGILVAAPERATFILTNGEHKSGIVAAHGDQHENLINGFLNLGQDNDKDVTFPMDQVAIIDVVGGQPSQDELAQLPPGTGHVLFPRNGGPAQGRFVNMINGDTLVWEFQGGQRQNFPLRDVARVYLNPDSARRIFNFTPRATAAAPAAAPVSVGQPVAQVRVDAKQGWTDGGVNVNQGDRVSFHASGQIAYGRSAGQTAPPEGAGERRANYPAPNAPVGALLGRIGNGPPFVIGSQTDPIQMPASGRLMLGVNDNELTDNSGFFLVAVNK